MEQLQSHIWVTASSYWGNICAFPHILGSPSSYMTLQLLHSEFPYIWGKFSFLFYQCITNRGTMQRTPSSMVVTHLKHGHDNIHKKTGSNRKDKLHPQIGHPSPKTAQSSLEDKTISVQGHDTLDRWWNTLYLRKGCYPHHSGTRKRARLRIDIRIQGPLC